jgi:hypothetical protein
MEWIFSRPLTQMRKSRDLSHTTHTRGQDVTPKTKCYTGTKCHNSKNGKNEQKIQQVKMSQRDKMSLRDKMSHFMGKIGHKTQQDKL